MAKLYEVEDVSFFRPVSLFTPLIQLQDMTKEDKKEFLAKQKRKIRKYKRVIPEYRRR